MVDTLLYALVVEDSPTIRQLIVFVLSRVKGLKVVEANDGADALKKLSQQHFDVLMTGINMPVMDGYESSRKMRELNITLPIIAITACIHNEVVENVKKSGINEIIVKPFLPDELCKTILNYIH